MADCQVLDGKALAAEIRSKIAVEIIELKKKYAGFQPQLSIIQVGDLEDSSVYIRMKSKAAAEVGIAVKHLKLSRQALLEIHALFSFGVFKLLLAM